MRLLLAASTLLLAAAPGATQDHHAGPAATPDGPAVDCVTISQIRSTQVRDGATIDFTMAGGKVYRNTLDGGECPQLGFEKRFMYKTTGSQLCSLDTISVLVQPGLTRGAGCGLGKFQPVKLAAH